jgi:hypothetical protein
MSVSGRRIAELAQDVADAHDAADALRTLTDLRQELDQYERQQVAWALSSGRSFTDIARALGITRQAAHRRFKDLAPAGRRGKRTPASAEVLLVLAYARAEALALRAPVVHPEHVLLGILRNDDRRAAAALQAAGITLETARLRARAHDRDGARSTRQALARATLRAREEDAGQVGVDHLLRGVLAVLRHEPGSLDVPAARVIAALDRAPAPSGVACA